MEFIEAPAFTRHVHEYLDDDRYRALQGALAANPDLGDVMPGAGKYEDVLGFSKSATTEEITAHGYVLTPGRYVGAEQVEDDDAPFEQKMKRLAQTLATRLQESAHLETPIEQYLASLGYPVNKEGAS